jgi:hypothetical protein
LSSTKSGIEFMVLLSTVDCKQQIEYSSVQYMYLCRVTLMEKLWQVLRHSCDGVSDGHCATIHRVENVGGKVLPSKKYSHSRLDMTGR